MRMSKFLPVLVLVIVHKRSVDCLPDLIPEAITVYRNPDFFKNLNYGTKIGYHQKPTKAPQGDQDNYKYPGETKKPNPPPSSPGFEVNYDNSPEFHHEPRDIFVDTTYKPNRKKGPYGPRYQDNNLEYSSKYKKPAEVTESEEDESKDSREGSNKKEPEPREFVSVLNESPEEEFRSYHEPILLARPSFQNSGFERGVYSQPYPFNRTSPILYEDWKFYTYPKIYSNGHLKSESSRVYSEEPPSNAFESDERPSYSSTYDDDSGESTNIFESEEFKNLGADTKHIYKKLLNPKKSVFFKFHSTPKFKKLKLKLKKKKHLHNTDWFDQYPFNF